VKSKDGYRLLRGVRKGGKSRKNQKTGSKLGEERSQSRTEKRILIAGRVKKAGIPFS